MPAITLEMGANAPIFVSVIIELYFYRGDCYVRTKTTARPYRRIRARRRD